MTNSVLVVEDDAEISELISCYLKANQMEVEIAKESRAMDSALKSRSFDLLLLDLNLPGEDGLSILRRIRSGSSLPIIVVTAMGEDVDKIIGLEMGADDYLAKPFNPRELLARIRCVLRRPADADQYDNSAGNEFSFSGWKLSLLRRSLEAPCGTTVTITAAEFDLLHALCENPNRVLTRDQLINMTSGPISGPFERSIDTLICRLRQKLDEDIKAPKIIQTVRSEGYIFVSEVKRS